MLASLPPPSDGSLPKTGYELAKAVRANASKVYGIRWSHRTRSRPRCPVRPLRRGRRVRFAALLASALRASGTDFIVVAVRSRGI
jgi:hypothetical protein